MKTTIFVQNLKCSGCASTIIKNLKTFKGVLDLNVDNETDSINIETGEGFNSLEIEQRLNELGYPVTTEENSLMTKAKSYVSCMIGRLDPMDNKN
jgi:copper chaperone